MKKIKRFLREHPTYWWKVPGIILILTIVACSIKIDTVDMPSSVNGGDIVPVHLVVKISTNDTRTARFMVAVLVPKVWKIAQNAVITFTSEISTGDQPMTVIPSGTPAPGGNGLDWPLYLLQTVGNGGNLLNEYEWVAFYSNSTYSVAANMDYKVDVYIKMKTSIDNLQCKLGFCVANSSDGLTDAQYYSSYFSSCFQVHGQGDLIDFCYPQLASVDPRTSLDNDIVTVSFDGAVADNDLKNASQVYLCAKGYLSNGDSIEVCDHSDAMKLESLGLSRWRKDIWPRQLFKLTDEQHLTRLSYFFTDATGSTKVGYGGGSDPFTYTFKCQ